MGDATAPAVAAKPLLKDIPFKTFDEVLLQRAVDEDQSPLIAYPRTKHGVDDYELFTGVQLNHLVDGAVHALMREGIEAVYEDTIAAIYGPSDLDYIFTVFALGRLGYTTFILSPRLPVNAIVNLLQDVPATLFLYGTQHLSIATQTSSQLPLKLVPILTRSQYDTPTIAAPFSRAGVDPAKETARKLIMMHSSGSTGLPKPIHFTNARLLSTFRTAQQLTAFQSVPLFHAHGFVSFVQAIYTQKTIYLFNGHIPQTHETIVAAVKGIESIGGKGPEIVWTVPYVLKLLAEKREGIDVLKRCKVVSCSGSRCPDELGDLLVREGVHFGSAFGATEVALILTSLNRPPEDKAWDYLRPPPHVAPYILMRPIEPNNPICECIVLDGHKGKLKTNSNDPPNSWHTSDLFIAHATIPNAWKFVGRADDRVTLTNGEKVLPLPIEGRIQQDPLVREAVVFGVDRAVPGLLLFRASAARGLSDDDFVEKVWPAIEDANSHAEGFSQIGRDMIAVIAEDVECPSTDKSSIKRAAVYREFKDVIDGVYARLENGMEGTLKLSVEELKEWLVASFADLGVSLENPETDFFSAGVDSLKAIQMRGLIIKNLDLGGNVSKCGSMIVYDCGNVARLAQKVFAIRVGEVAESAVSDDISVMEGLIEQYSKFDTWRESSETPESHVVILTGATGSLGSHILSHLIALPTVSKIYCLFRPSHTSASQTPLSRLESALKARDLSLLPSPKVVALTSDLSTPTLGLETQTLSKLRSETTHIIHCAWEVNFALPIQSFTPQLASLQNLLNLSLSTPFSSPARLLFCSSIGTAMATPSTASCSRVEIPETPIADMRHCSATGYARSKLVAEKMIEHATTTAGAKATVLRIGQIVPSAGAGSALWNEKEMIPLLIRSALTTGVLPDRPGGSDGCSWIDVDVLSQAILEIGGIGILADPAGPKKVDEKEKTRLVYNLVHPHPFSWKTSFLPALRAAGLEFQTVGWAEWLSKLGESEADVEKNPSRKLLGFWEKGPRAGGEREVVFSTRDAEESSEALRKSESLVGGDYVKRLVAAWREVW
ncbi:Nonribosomal peptide synthase enzyme [Hyphodiscus hymeniophilus]|uniref:Nonribosomal peptide synthase enzyme n=1 Tax=Hyphodiscus hymeniophilus TaxID=353542 RepID=A0A9P6SMY8_9HELO|nr:Nonribosomal peptide synthase enzyme [Hyphodiscus hymeniophilus]